MAPREQPAWRRRSRRLLAVRMMAAKVAWLDGRLRWHEERVVWEDANGRMAPGPADLARAQRTLNKIARYPIAGDLVFGDAATWLATRRAQLERAKQLAALCAPDLPALARQARARNPQAAQQLAALLCVEALCLDTLPAAPSSALVACGEPAEEPLRVFLLDRAAPEAARALAALTLGALHGRVLDSQKPAHPPQLDGAWLKRAYTLGSSAGLMADPALVSSLLRDENGEDLARRCTRVTESGDGLQLPPVLLRELLAREIAPTRVVALAEATASAASWIESVVNRRPASTALRSDRKSPVPEERRQRQRQAARALTERIHSIARATADPTAVALAVHFTQRMLEVGDGSAGLAEAAVTVLDDVQQLPIALQRPCLELLVELHGQLWDPAGRPADSRADRETRRLAAWLLACWQQKGRPLLKLMRLTGDAALVREAVVQGISRMLAGHDWCDAAQYRYLLALTRDLCPPGDRQLVWTLARLLDLFPEASAARALLQPIVRHLLPAPLWLREHFLESALHAIPWTRNGVAEALPRLARHVPRLIRFAEADPSDFCVCQASTAAALALDRADRETAAEWLEWLLAHLTERFSGTERGYEHAAALEIGVPLALALAPGDLHQFQAIVVAALDHPFRHDEARIRPALAALTRFPGLRAPLAALFPQQPHRCTELLVRAGLAMRLGEAALGPLTLLDPSAQAREPVQDVEAAATAGTEAGWCEVLHLAPELAATAAAYRQAQGLLGKSGEVPAGLQRVLNLPRRLAQELAYLEARLASEPGRADLAARRRSLQARLSDEVGMQARLQEEVRERLAQVSAEAQMAAAEQQVLACYRARLEAVAGPLPAGLFLDTDLLNATLLSVDITRNRRLLARLLRAHLAGDRGWRERHPANAAFLRLLSTQGGNADAWLATHPRGFPCAAVPGGRVRLRLERDPLAILQMGNYFDTCLSLGAMNAFSTVANACELNKRVVYAHDSAGRVIGRKLIGITAQGELVGFHTYTSLPDEAGNAAVRTIVRRYLETFAARCGLKQADEGVIPTLFAEAWYDDGTVAWEDEDAAPRKSYPRRSHQAARTEGGMDTER